MDMILPLGEFLSNMLPSQHTIGPEQRIRAAGFVRNETETAVRFGVGDMHPHHRCDIVHDSDRRRRFVYGDTSLLLERRAVF
jgi:hypothetical protein